MTIADVRGAIDAAEEITPEDLAAGVGAPPSDPAAGGDGPPPEDGPPDPPRELFGVDYPRNDFGNGQRLLLYYGDAVKFVPRLSWHVWTGRRWRADEDEIAVRSFAQKVAAHIEDEAAVINATPRQAETLDEWRLSREVYDRLHKVGAKARTDEDAAEYARLCVLKDEAARIRDKVSAARKAHRDFARSSGNSGKIKNMLIEATTAAAVSVGALNGDALKVNCESGTLSFVQVPCPHAAEFGAEELLWVVEEAPHDPDDMITKICRAKYDPAAECPAWMAFWRVVQPDPEMQAFLQRWFGYSLLGLTTEQKLVFLFGGGRNGKSTAVDTIARILNDYATSLPIETLTGSEQRKGSDATPDLVRLPGARMVRASEPEQGQKMKEALIKALTGGEPIMVRRMMQEFVEVTPEFKLTISGNHKPEVRGADDGIWRRILLVEFGEQIPETAVDPLLPQKLMAESAGIFAWLVRGALDYLQGGLRPPAAVVAATSEYRQESDPMRVFLQSECAIVGGDCFITAAQLAYAFRAWQLDETGDAWGQRQVQLGLKARSNNVKGADGAVYRPVKRSRQGYAGIRLSDAAAERVVRYAGRLDLLISDADKLVDEVAALNAEAGGV